MNDFWMWFRIIFLALFFGVCIIGYLRFKKMAAKDMEDDLMHIQPLSDYECAKRARMIQDAQPYYITGDGTVHPINNVKGERKMITTYCNTCGKIKSIEGEGVCMCIRIKSKLETGKRYLVSDFISRKNYGSNAGITINPPITEITILEMTKDGLYVKVDRDGWVRTEYIDVVAELNTESVWGVMGSKGDKEKEHTWEDYRKALYDGETVQGKTKILFKLFLRGNFVGYERWEFPWGWCYSNAFIESLSPTGARAWHGCYIVHDSKTLIDKIEGE